MISALTDLSADAPGCPLCRGDGAERFLQVDGRDYWRCHACELRFLDPTHLPAREVELAQYRLHENEIDDAGYRAFLNRLADPLMGKLSPGSAGLDFGCGPGPALANIMREAGHTMTVYDPFFAPGDWVLAQTYDFVTCTEVVEHFHDPAAAFAQLDGLLRPGGWLGLMTCFQTDDARFANWHYRKDVTHVAFYREATLRWLAQSLGWTCEVPRKNVVLMHKSE